MIRALVPYSTIHLTVFLWSDSKLPLCWWDLLFFLWERNLGLISKHGTAHSNQSLPCLHVSTQKYPVPFWKLYEFPSHFLGQVISKLEYFGAISAYRYTWVSRSKNWRLQFYGLRVKVFHETFLYIFHLYIICRCLDHQIIYQCISNHGFHHHDIDHLKSIIALQMKFRYISGTSLILFYSCHYSFIRKFYNKVIYEDDNFYGVLLRTAL